jgi:hypothetical protein
LPPAEAGCDGHSAAVRCRAPVRKAPRERWDVITERVTFRAKYGHGDELVALLKESFGDMIPREGLRSARVYTDATGQMFTVVLEMDFDDLASWTKLAGGDPEVYASDRFQEWFGRMVAVTEMGERQLLNMEVIG